MIHIVAAGSCGWGPCRAHGVRERGESLLLVVLLLSMMRTNLLGQHAVELLGLDDGARESVEDEAVAAFGARDVVADDADHLSRWEGDLRP